MTAMNLNCNTYVIAIDNTSKSATLSPDDANQTSVVLYNGSTTAVAVMSGGGAAAPTAVFPTSATAGNPSVVIGPGAIVTFTKNAGHQFISAIQASAGTGSLYIKVGPGQ